MKLKKCLLCGNHNWTKFPKNALERSVRSDGFILTTNFEKSQCDICGLVQSEEINDQNKLSEMYQNEYDIYGFRPGAEKFVSGRYGALSKAIFDVLPKSFDPKNILEVGAGNGGALASVQKIWKNSHCIGLEPSSSAVKLANDLRINVYEGALGGNLPNKILKQKYDLIYSIHVIEHTENPIEFLKNAKPLLNKGGYLIITCPNTEKANLEIMRPDHLYSFLPKHLHDVVNIAGFKVLAQSQCPGGSEDLDYEYNQLILAKYDDEEEEERDITFHKNPSHNLNKIFLDKSEYIKRFDSLESVIQDRMQSNISEWYCFGSGGWATIFACYAPKVWESLQGCVIDGGEKRIFNGKAVINFEDIRNKKNIGYILAVNPKTQNILKDRLQKQGINNIITFNDIIEA